MAEKIKILMLGVNDDPTPGHLLYAYHHLPPEYEPCAVIQKTSEENRQYALFPNPVERALKMFFQRNLWTRLQWLFRYHLRPKVNKSCPEYHFKGNELVGYSAKDILRRCPKGFIPEVIAIYWTSGFISSRIVRELHELTGAVVVYVFVDEAALTGGCHYPFECEGFQTDCNNCPALAEGKKLAAIQLALKKENLSKVPLYAAATPWDVLQAQKSAIFRHATMLPITTKPDMNIFPKEEARQSLDIPSSAFVVLMGAKGTQDKRKGFTYAIQALQKAAKVLPQMIVLIAGNADERLRESLHGVPCRFLGMLSLPDLHRAFCATDVFLSATIADSGPMMVNMASACGTPTIAFPVGVAVSLVRHKEAGYMAKLKDVDDMAEGLCYMACLSTEAYQLMSQRCKELLDEAASKGTWLEQMIRILRPTSA